MEQGKAALSAPPKIVAYEHLAGASGPAMNYRAPRYDARTLFNGPFPVAMLSDEPHILCDLSITGLSAIGSAQDLEQLTDGREVKLSLCLGDAILHESNARVTRHEDTALGRKLGVQFLGRGLDLNTVLSQYRREVLKGRLRASLFGETTRPDTNFRLLCVDILNWLRTCRSILEADGSDHTSIREEVVHDCRDAIHSAWITAGQEANAALEQVLEDPPALAAMKRFAERVLTTELIVSPLWRRAYEKPLGFPGDFALLEQLHRPAGLGTHPYSDFLDLLFRDAFGWMPSRTAALVQALSREMSHNKEAVDLKIATIGCGAGEELIALFERSRFPRPLSVTLLEHDAGALEHVYGRLIPLSIAASDRIRLNALHASHDQLVDGGELTGKLTMQNIILAPSIFDYLRHRSAANLLEALYQSLAPGGVIIAGCLRRHPQSSRWASELFCDWSMIHRNRDEVVALALRLPRAKIEVRLDTRGDVYILSVRRSRADH